MCKSLFISLLFLITWCISQAQIIDRAPSGQVGSRAITGGSEAVKIDTKTPIGDLIKKLELPWDFVETGKLYWIGYTDNMYAIAARKDKAIAPLVSFIASTTNRHAKIGAIYTLHLIGINSSVVGRFVEEFKNKDARNALLDLLKYDELSHTIMTLLTRDPWQSDVPKLFNALSHSKTNYWGILNGLTQYGIKNLPSHQEIPSVYDKIFVSVPYSNGDFETSVKTYKSIFTKIENLKNGEITVESRCYDQSEWQSIRGEGTGWDVKNDILTLSVGGFIGDATNISYADLGNELQYYLIGNHLYICSAQTMKERLVNWWGEQSLSAKKDFSQNKAVNHNPFGRVFR